MESSLARHPLDSDVLELIFDLLSGQQEYYHNYSGRDRVIWPRPLPAAFTVASVCQFWRDVALARSNLWRDIQFNADKAQEGKVSAYIDLMLLRSGETPLNVVIYCQRHEEITERAYATWSRLMPRVQELVIDIAGYELPRSASYSVIACLLLPTPELYSCKICGDPDDEEWRSQVAWEPTDQFLPHAPNLRELHTGPLPLSKLWPRNAQLIAIGSNIVSNLTSSTVIFKRCPTLHTYGVGTWGWRYRDDSNVPESAGLGVPSSLRVVTLGADELLGDHNVASRDLANITHLVLDHAYSLELRPTVQLPRLKSLAICFPNESGFLFELFARTPNVTELRLLDDHRLDWAVGPNFIGDWTSSSNLRLLPSLRRLGFSQWKSRARRDAAVEYISTFLAQREQAALPVQIETCTLWETSRKATEIPRGLLEMANKASRTKVVASLLPEPCFDPFFDE